MTAPARTGLKQNWLQFTLNDVNRTDFLKTLGFGVALIGTGQFVASCKSGGLMPGMEGMNTPSMPVSGTQRFLGPDV